MAGSPLPRTAEARSCVVCGRDGERCLRDVTDRLLQAPGTWSLRECQACRLAWLDPRPDPDDLGRLYEGAYMTHANGVERSHRLTDAFLDAVYGRPGRPASAPWAARVPMLDDVLGGAGAWLTPKGQARLLDVGCGSGRFLARMARRGWTVTGMEPDPEAAAVARARGLAVVDTLAALDGRAFDAVTLHHVIEHLPDPHDTVRALAARLAPGGRLVVVTPNLHSLGRRRFDAAWVHWDPPRHLWLFGRDALGRVLTGAGLQVERLWASARNARFVGAQAAPIRRTGRADAGTPSTLARLRGLAFQAREHGQALFDRDAGEELVAVARRPGAGG